MAPTKANVHLSPTAPSPRPEVRPAALRWLARKAHREHVEPSQLPASQADGTEDFFEVGREWAEQRLLNERQIGLHVDDGDDLTWKRLVTHSASFPSEQSGDLFRLWAQSNGYQALIWACAADWLVIFAKGDCLSRAHIDQLTFHLIWRTLTYRGRYQGWTAFAGKATQ